jgi:hypothetical protein
MRAIAPLFRACQFAITRHALLYADGFALMTSSLGDDYCLSRRNSRFSTAAGRFRSIGGCDTIGRREMPIRDDFAFDARRFFSRFQFVITQ